ncbi:MAG: 50S ribosomal protein L29 [Pseudomonadota bacterium]
MAKIAIKDKSVDEIKQSLSDLLSLSFKLQLQKTTQQLKDFNQIKLVRRNIARIKTELGFRGEQ